MTISGQTAYSADTTGERPERAIDLQDLRPDVTAMARLYRDGMETGWHSHRRGQILMCEAGCMTAQTPEATFTLPRNHAMSIRPGIPHIVRAHGAVDMKTVYIEPRNDLGIDWSRERVFAVSRLLGAAIGALVAEPADYKDDSRGAHLGALILDEVRNAADQPYSLPVPRSVHLQKLGDALTRDPSLRHDIDTWAADLGMSRRTLTRRIRDDLGMSFVEWRDRIRIVQALRMQAEGIRPDRIAVATGFPSTARLRHVLKAVDTGTC